MSSFPSFPDFFHELWAKEKSPFPWQTMLADRAIENGWPDAIDLPTASGKTACLDIAVWALAKQAGDEKRNTPRRIWFVVDRRIVVDEAYDRAHKIAAALESSDSPAVRAVADRLLGLRGLRAAIVARFSRARSLATRSLPTNTLGCFGCGRYKIAVWPTRPHSVACEPVASASAIACLSSGSCNRTLISSCARSASAVAATTPSVMPECPTCTIGSR